MLKKITLLAALCGVCSLSYGQSGKKEKTFSFEASYIGDFYGNATGGLRTGAGFMGMGNLSVGFDTGKAGWWRGGSFFVHGASIHGKSLSDNYLGDLQIASNIDCGEHTYMHEMWFRQELGAFSFIVGLQDLNAEFMVSEGAGEFINSSFGVESVIAVGTPMPIFPLTGLGLIARWDIGERWAVQTALFDGDQTPFEDNPYNLKWSLSKRDGLLSMTEVHSRLGSGTYKLGAYYHSASDNYGVYVQGDQPLGERVGLFGQATVAPKSKNINNYYIGLGANLSGVFSECGRDALGLAVAHAGLHDVGHKHETAIELYYMYRFSDNIALQPDVQYIINPSGGEARLKNALATILRLHIDF